jgi:hypothetical protein
MPVQRPGPQKTPEQICGAQPRSGQSSPGMILE